MAERTLIRAPSGVGRFLPGGAGSRTRRLVRGAPVAVLACAVATGLGLAASLEGKPGVGAMFVVAVCVSTYVGGWWSGLLAGVLAYLAASWFFIEPTHSLIVNADAVFFTGALVLASVTMSWLVERERGARGRLAEALTEEQRLGDDLRAGS